MDKCKILFVCLGNICRSPAAEGIMKQIVAKSNLSDKFIIDSAGLQGYHSGEKADKRMRERAASRGYNLTSISRQIVLDDFNKFDYIVAMDSDNVRGLKGLTDNPKYINKISLATDYCSTHNDKFVPDPYYGGIEGFDIVLDILEDACAGLLNKIK